MEISWKGLGLKSLPGGLRPAAGAEFHQPAGCDAADVLYPRGKISDRNRFHGFESLPGNRPPSLKVPQNPNEMGLLILGNSLDDYKLKISQTREDRKVFCFSVEIRLAGRPLCPWREAAI